VAIPQPPVTAREDSPQQTQTRVNRNFHRLYTAENDAEFAGKEPLWQYKNSKHQDMPRIEHGFNDDGTIKVPDAPKVPGFDPLNQQFRWPDGTLRKEYPPRNPYTVAARRRVHELVTHCRMQDKNVVDENGQSIRHNIGVLWCAHARYLVDKLGIHPETNDEGEWYGRDDEYVDPLLHPEHPLNQMCAKLGVSLQEKWEQYDEEFAEECRERFKEARIRDEMGDAYRPKSKLLNISADAPQRVDFSCEEVGRQSPMEPQTPVTPVDEVE
jgi:hypothetical protein